MSSKSARIRKKGIIYREIFGDEKVEVKPVSTSKERGTSEYQEFVRKESKKKEYAEMSSADRLKKIAKKWRKLKKNLKDTV